MEAALLSNTLHEYRDDDIDGANAVVAQILSIRSQWTVTHKTIEYFDKTGKLPEPKPEQDLLAPLPGSAEVAEQRVELARLNSNICKYQKKITDNPEHKKVDLWREQLAKMEALKQELKDKIVTLTYASK
ncbi:hypothetical protein [Dyadobacter soli]|nr:hypothetical protein [Dyadobacter soli]